MFGRRVFAFGLEARHQRTFLVGDEFHTPRRCPWCRPSNSGFDELFVACGIHHDVFSQGGEGGYGSVIAAKRRVSFMLKHSCVERVKTSYCK